MKTLMFNDSKEENNLFKISQEIIETELKEMGWQVDKLILREMDNTPCPGCFGRWIKTSVTAFLYVKKFIKKGYMLSHRTIIYNTDFEDAEL